MNTLINKLMILRTNGIGPAKYNALLGRFGTPDAVVASMGNVTDMYDAVMREVDQAQRLNIKYVCDDEDLYPENLRNVKNHPPVICVRGNLDVLRRSMVAIVGTRHATATGMGFVADIAHRFAEDGAVVVSGMAIGTDTAAHRGALRAVGNVQTIAVLAGGADYIWPLENEGLYWEIVERGAIISEMPVGYGIGGLPVWLIN